jgi:hypothetical protein
MTCPRCQIDYNAEGWDECPHCGEGLTIVTSGVMKTSTIMISSGAEEEAGVYRSVDEVPEPLRKMLVKSTSGLNSGTIFIADERGKEEIAKAIRNLPRQTGSQTLGLPGASSQAAVELRRGWRSPSAIVFGALLAVFTAAVGWIVLTHTW